MNFITKAPVMLCGGDYNPDQWLDRPDILEADIRMMKKAGMNSVTLGVFAWAAYEPREGEYNFTWLREIMDRLYDQGIYTELATPTGAKPNWLARKYRRGSTSLMRDYVRRSEPGRAKTWVLEGQNSRGWYGAVALRRLVTSRKGQFRWRNPLENPYILRDKTRSTIESRYPDVAFAMSNA